MHRRTRKEMKRDSEAHYHSMEEHTPDQKAAERFRRKPYKLPSKKSTEARKDERYDSKRSIRR